jgi:hypothetical protein
MVRDDCNRPAAAVAEESARMAELARKNGATQVRVARDQAEAASLATARRSAFSALARVSPTTILEDATVPRSELAKMIRFVAAVAAKYKLRIGTFGHMGDGNLHPTFLTDERDAPQMQRVHEAFRNCRFQSIRIFPGSQRRADFIVRIVGRTTFLGQQQMVRRDLARDRQRVILRLPDQLYRAGG